MRVHFQDNFVILHMSHTDIRSDPRILKEMKALQGAFNCNVIGIGFELDEAEAPSINEENSKLKIFSRILTTRKFRFLPRVLRYAINFFELTFKLFWPSIQIKPTVVHCHDTLALPAGWLIKVFTGCKLIYDAHELESNKNGQNKVLSLGTLFIEKIVWPKVDLLVSVSDQILAWYKNRLGYKKCVLVLNSPVFRNADINGRQIVSSGVHYFHRKYGLDDDALVFVYLGILGPGRGIDVTLEAFKDVPSNAHVVFVGYGAYESMVLEYSRQFSNIHFHPAVPHNQVVPLVSNADYGLCLVENVSLSDYYCLPNKLFEYAFSNIPILASRFPEISKMIEKYSLGICCDLEENSIRQAINKIISIRPKFPSTDISDLSWNSQAHRLIGAYKEILPL